MALFASLLSFSGTTLFEAAFAGMANNAPPALQLAPECAFGLIVGISFGGLALAFNVGNLRTLTAHSPLAMALVVASAAFAFEPVVFCACIGGWRRGVQGGAFERDDESEPPS